MHIPMRSKYVDEAFGTFFIFGAHTIRTMEGSNICIVDLGVSDGTSNRDIFTDIPLSVAEIIMESHNRFKNEMYDLLCKDSTSGQK